MSKVFLRGRGDSFRGERGTATVPCRHMPDIEFRLLGPLAVVRDDTEVDLGGRRRRAALALLLLEPGRPVPTDRIIDRLWGESPPAGAVGTLQSYISRLRGALEPDRKAGGATTVLVSEASGYVLRVTPEQVDAQRFEKLADEGGAALAAARPEDAEALLTEALNLWRGPALAEFAYESWAQPAIERLETRRLAALEDRAAAQLALGRHAAVAGELTELVSRYPTSERLRGHHALALYRSGRQVEALDSLRAARDALREELGLDPGPELRELEERILNQDPELAAVPATAPAAAKTAPRRPAQPPAGSVARDDDFVGREPELARIAGALERTSESRGGVLLVAGHAGIGKTRLAQRVSALGGEAGFATVWGSCYESEDPPPFWPWVRVVRQAVDLLPDDALTPSARLFLAQLVPELAEGDTPPPTAASADAARYQLYEAVAELLAQVSREQPLFAVLDDVHWADPASCALLEVVATRASQLPLLIAVTYRPGEQDPDGPLTRTLAVLGRVGPTERLELSGLDLDDLERLLADRYPGEERLAATVHARTDGNPFFATELVRLLEGETASEADRERLARTAVPTGVRDVLLRRLGRLEAESRRALEIAAAIGRDFEIWLLADALGTDRISVAEWLDGAVDAGLVVAADADAPGTLRFSHALVREAVLAALGPTALARAHARVAQALMAREPLDDDRAELLAGHVWSAAALLDPADAAQRIQNAGDVAMRRLAYERAEELFVRAARLRSSLPDTPANLEAELEGELRLASLWMMTRGLAGSGVSDLVHGARGLAEKLGRTSLLVRVLAAVVMHDVPAGEFRNAQAAADASLEVAERSADPVELAFAHFNVGSVSVHMGEIAKARRHLEASMGFWDRQSAEGATGVEALFDVMTLPPALWIPAWLGIASAFAGEAEAAEGAFVRMHAASAALGGPYVRLAGIGFESWIAVCADDVERVRRLVDEAFEIADPFLYPLWGAGNLVYRGWVKGKTGDIEGAMADIERGTRLWEDSGLGMLRGYFAGVRAEIEIEAGDLSAAAASIEQGLKDSFETRETIFVPALLRLRAATREDPADARADLEEAIALANEQGALLLGRRAQDALDAVESKA